mmetsp:Transcript_19974/g.46183  ORF Transcript_19974/g.46183 Transcript_19974/m.46183 type:complete len:177 (-) Transcript_19974:373-903(-)
MGDARRYTRLRLVMEKVLVTSTSESQREDMKSVFSDMFEAHPHLGDLFDEIYPQIEQQMRSGITEEFELLAKQNEINEKLLALEELLEAAENGGVAEAPPTVRPLPEGMTPEDVLRRQTHELKQRELESLLAEQSGLEEDNRELKAAIQEQDSQMDASTQELNDIRSQVQAAAEAV